MRGRVALGVLCVAALAACSGGSKPKVTRPALSRESPASDSTGSTESTARPPASLPAALCAAYAADLDRRKGNVGIELAGLTAAELRDRFDEGNRTVQAMIDAASGDLQSSLRAQLQAQQAGQVEIEQAWGTTGADLATEAKAAGFHDISSYVTRGGIALPDGSTVTVAAVARLATRNHGRLAAGCDDPSLGVRADERQPAPPTGAIVYSGGGSPTANPTLEVVSTDGSDTRELLPPGRESRYGAVVGADGAVAFVAVDSAGAVSLYTAPSVDALNRATAVDLPATCPGWAPGRHALVATILDDPVDRRGVYVIEGAGAPVSIDLPFPAADVGCASFAGDAGVVLVGRNLFGGGFELWRVPRSGAATKIFGRADCNASLGDVSPDATTAAVTMLCVDVRDDGVHLVDVAGGRDDHVAPVIAGSAHFSPDGAWLAFGSCPFGCDTSADTRVTVMRSDGQGSHPIVATQSSWPSWLPAGAVTGSNPTT